MVSPSKEEAPNEGAGGLAEKGKLIKRGSGAWEDKHSVLGKPRRVADGRFRRRADEDQPNRQLKRTRITDGSLGLPWRGEPTGVVDCGEVITGTNIGACDVFHDTQRRTRGTADGGDEEENSRSSQENHEETYSSGSRRRAANFILAVPVSSESLPRTISPMTAKALAEGIHYLVL